MFHPCCCGHRAPQVTLPSPSHGGSRAKPRLCWGEPGHGPVSSPCFPFPSPCASVWGGARWGGPAAIRGCGAWSGDVQPAWSQGSLHSVPPWECSFSGARETIPKKEQSEGKLIPNGDISPLRNRFDLSTHGSCELGHRHTMLFQRDFFFKVYYFPLL